MTETPEPIPPPLLPPRVGAEHLRNLEAPALDAEAARLAEAERATRTAMSPYDRQLREIHARQEEIATERRRRERAGRHAARIAVREMAGSGEMPTLADALLAEPSPLPEARPLAEVRAFLASGGQVGFGYPTRLGVLGFTDGRQLRNAATWGEARALYADGWEPGAPGSAGVRGVRVHLSGTRVERMVTPAEVVLELAGGEAVTTGQPS
ncbi:MAG: hypothetical protein ABSE52_08265 [Candidatus Dormibacteria bacterium]|jgi:hypothetical protein